MRTVDSFHNTNGEIALERDPLTANTDVVDDCRDQKTMCMKCTYGHVSTALSQTC